ncbi:MAG: patatin-like phospholipase family protein [Calditrichia bacterium]
MSDHSSKGNLALTLSGGGALAAYQVGFLRRLLQYHPELNFPILTGISAGAINAAYLANYNGSFKQAVDSLYALWENIMISQVFRVDAPAIFLDLFKRLFHAFSLGFIERSRFRSLVRTEPLRQFLEEHLKPENGIIPGIERNIRNGRLHAVAISGTSYASNQTITWTEGCCLVDWERPNRVSHATRLTIDHVMASAAIPVLFPAIRVAREWYADGGIHFYCPFSAAIHLGADRVLSVSTRYQASAGEGEEPGVQDYPSMAQVMGVLMNAVFLDMLEQDAARLELTNGLLEKLPEEARYGKRVVRTFIRRPSRDLGEIAEHFEPALPFFFRQMLRSHGTNKSSGRDWLGMLMFQPDYVRNLLELGEKDAEDKKAEIEDFLS